MSEYRTADDTMASMGWKGWVSSIYTGLIVAGIFTNLTIREIKTRLDKLEAAVAGGSWPTTSPSRAGDAPAAALEKTP